MASLPALSAGSVTIGYLSDLVGVAHQIAIEKRYYADLGLNVNATWYPSGDAMLKDPTWDIASADVVTNIRGSGQFTGVGISMDASAINQLVGTEAGVDAWPPVSFASETVCVPPNSTEEYVVHACLKSAGYDLQDVTFEYASNCVEALTSSASTTNHGGFSPPSLWNVLESVDEEADTICSGASVYATVTHGHMISNDFANRADSTIVAKVLAGWLRAVEFLNKDQENFKDIIVAMSSFHGSGTRAIPSVESMQLELRLVGLFGLQQQLDLMERRGEPPLSNYDIWTNEVGNFLLDQSVITTLKNPTTYITDEYMIQINEDPVLRAWATGEQATTSSGCTDVPDWIDSGGDNCTWYESGTTDRCTEFGDLFADQDGLSAFGACCVCGGGDGGALGCRDLVAWTDNLGFDCDWYAASIADRCEDPADGALGFNAQFACCACGGGLTQCIDKPGWEDVGGDTCAWYEVPGRCDLFGHVEAFASLDGTLPNEACCVCKGTTTPEQLVTIDPAEFFLVNGVVPTCEQLADDYCDWIISDDLPDCCLTECTAENQALTVCLIREFTGEDLTDCPVAECAAAPAFKGPSSGTKQIEPIESFGFGSVFFNLGSAEDRCPDEFNSFFQCIISDCPAFVDVCPDLAFPETLGPAMSTSTPAPMSASSPAGTPPTDATEESVAEPLEFILLNGVAPTCAKLEEDYCDWFSSEDAEDCCLADCTEENQAVAVCLILENTGVDRSDCEVAECAATTSSKGTSASTKQFDLNLAEFYLSFGEGVIYSAALAQDSCPDEWTQFIRCVITDCPNFLEVCPEVLPDLPFASATEKQATKSKWLPGGFGF